MRKRMQKWLLTVGLGLSVFAISSSAQTNASIANLSSTPVQDSDLLKLLEITKIKLDGAEAKILLLEERLAAKDDRITAKDGIIALRDEQLKLAQSANQDRAQVNTGDARMLQACELQLQRADNEIHRLRFPGFWRSLFDVKTVTGAAVGFGAGRLTK